MIVAKLRPEQQQGQTRLALGILRTEVGPGSCAEGGCRREGRRPEAGDSRGGMGRCRILFMGKGWPNPSLPGDPTGAVAKTQTLL